jgi:hypothetical protein
MRVSLAVSCAFFFIFTSNVQSQSSSNPDISVIPRFRVESNDAAGSLSTPDLRLEEFEIAVQSYLNPYSRADIFLTKSGVGEEPIEIEEAYATFLRGLPLDLNVRVGKYLAEFGKLNALHPHAWAFLSKPLVLERFLGTEGINDLAVGTSLMIPLSNEIYSRISIDLLRGKTIGTVDPLTGTSSGGIGLADTLHRSVPYALSGRYMVFVPLGDVSDLELGISGMTGVHDPYHDLSFHYGALDAKYKWKPDMYTALTIQGEALINMRTVAAVPYFKDITTSGFYLSADYQFSKIYSVGGRVDWSQSPYSVDDRAKGFALFAGFAPVEETTAFRLEYQQQSLEGPGSNSTAINTIVLQFMFSMGPHKAHPF